MTQKKSDYLNEKIKVLIELMQDLPDDGSEYLLIVAVNTHNMGADDRGNLGECLSLSIAANGPIDFMAPVMKSVNEQMIIGVIEGFENFKNRH